MAGAFRVSGKDDGIFHHGRSARRYGSDQSVRLFRRALRGQVAVQIRRRPARGFGVLRRSGAGGPAPEGIGAVDFARAAQHRRFSGRAQSAPGAHDPLHRAHGAGRADAGGDARRRRRLVPRYGVAAGANPPPHRIAVALRLRLSHSIAAGHETARRTRRHRSRFHRPACLDRSVYPRRRLDRARRHVGIAVRRGPHSVGRDAALPFRGADHRHGRAGGSLVRLRHEREAARRAAAGDRAVLRRGVARARCARRKSRRRSFRARRAADHGRRADFRFGRRLSSGGVEHRGARAEETRPRRRADPPPARSFRAGRLAALRPRQMVSRRAAAALGLCAVLAPRWRADLARRQPDRPRDRRQAAVARRCQTLRRGDCRTLGNHGGLRAARLRGPGRPDAQARSRSRQHRSQRSAGRRSGRARAHSRPVRPDLVRFPSRPAGGLRAAAAALERAGKTRMAERNVAHAPRQTVSDAGRFAARLPAAAAIAALSGSRRLSASGAGRSVCRAHAAAAGQGQGGAGGRAEGAGQASGAGRNRGAACRQHAGAYRFVGRSARRTGVRVHAAGRNARRLSRTARDHRSDRGRARPAGPRRRLCAAARSAAQCAESHARSRRHRGQHPAGGILARSRRPSRKRFTRTPAPAGSAPTNS